jgi:hypothetical protein
MRKRYFLIPSFLCLCLLNAQETRSAAAILQERLLQMEEERDRSERAFHQLQAETRPVIEELTREKQRLQSELTQIRQTGVLLDSAQDTATRAGERAEAELAAVQRELEALQAQRLAEQREFAQTLNQLREEQRRLVEAQTGENIEAALRDRLDELLEQMAVSEAAAAALRAEKTELERESRDIQGLNRQLEADLQSAERRESLANAQLLALQSRVEQLQQELQEAFEQRDRAEQQRDELARRVNQLEIELEDLRESSVPRAEFEALQQSLQASLARNRELQAALEEELSRPDFTERLAQAERQRDLLDAQLKTMETRVQEAEARAAQEQNRRQDVADANISMVEHLAGLEASLRETQAERDRQAEEIRRLRDEQAEEIRSLREQQSNEMQALRDLQNELETELRSMAEILETNTQELQQFEELQVDFVSLQNDLQQRIELSEQQARDIEDLQRALGASMQEVERTRRELEAAGTGGGGPGIDEEERVRLVASQEKARRDMRILANHIVTLRQTLREQEEQQRQSDLERQLLLNRLRELEAGRPVQ